MFYYTSDNFVFEYGYSLLKSMRCYSPHRMLQEIIFTLRITLSGKQYVVDDRSITSELMFSNALHNMHHEYCITNLDRLKVIRILSRKFLPGATSSVE